MEIRIGRIVFTEQTCYTGEVMLNYVVGPNNGPPLLLLHAQTGSWESYLKVLEPLAQRFHVYAVDIRGHGKSSRTPGHYDWNTIGYDLRFFLKKVIQQKTIISGNSSGGLIALWLAAFVPELVAAIVLEDAPLFSAEMPRFRERDKFVFKGLRNLVETMEDKRGNPVEFISTSFVPVMEREQWTEKKLSPVATLVLRLLVGTYRMFYRIDPIDLTVLPFAPRIMIKSLSMFDVDFARAFVEERIYEGLDHAEALQITECPILILHGKWSRHPGFGLIGAMDDEDAAHAQRLNKRVVYKKLDVNHVIHVFKPEVFVNEVKKFAATVDFDGHDSISNQRVLEPVDVY
jgi:pimeloyl-ACP methyl ester carboxylesterase